MTKTVLITTSSFDETLPEIGQIKALGYELRLNPFKRKLTEEEISDLLSKGNVIGLIAGVEPLTAKVLKNAKNLKAIARCGIGMDNVDQDAAKSQGILLSNTPDAPTKAVAELCLGLMLTVLRQIPEQDRAIRAGGWERPMGGLLGARTLGLYGLGRIGTQVATLARAFGTTVLAHDPHITSSHIAQLCSREELFAQADILSLHVPTTPETSGLINKDTLAVMKPGAIIINTARGELIDEAALLEALTTGHIAGAGLDVYGSEPYQGPLKNMKNVVLTAHTGSYAKETRQIQEQQAAANLYAALKTVEAGEPTHG